MDELIESLQELQEMFKLQDVEYVAPTREIWRDDKFLGHEHTGEMFINIKLIKKT